MPLRSPRLGDRKAPSQLKPSSSDLDALHHKSSTDRSPKLVGDGRSSRGSQSDPLNQKRLGTRIAGLETQLEQAQEELKTLKDQLASAEAAKKQAQLELEKKKATKSATPEVEEAVLLAKRSPPKETQESTKTAYANADDHPNETDVFEVLVEKVRVVPRADGISQPIEENELNTKHVSLSTESTTIAEPYKPIVQELALKNNEISFLKSKMKEKEKEVGHACQENKNLKNQLDDATSKISAARVKDERLASRLKQLEEEVETSKGNTLRLNDKLEAIQGAKEAMETEMKKLRVQTEQWRKAADAAASVLAGNADMNSRRASERSTSMDKQYGSMFEPQNVGYAGFVGSPGLGEDSNDGFGSGKRKGSAIRLFGDLWKKSQR